MIKLSKKTCTECNNEAVFTCSKCGKPLCDIHKTHGFSMRTSSPTIDCKACKKKVSRMTRILGTLMIIGFIIGAIILLLYFGTVLSLF